MKDWPPSNFPIFLALMLLAATATALTAGDGKLAEDFAIYSYYFLVIGVTIRFLEFALPQSTQKKIVQLMTRFSNYMNQPDYISFDIPGTDNIRRRLYFRTPLPYRILRETKMGSYVKQIVMRLTVVMEGISRLLYTYSPQLYCGVREIKMRIPGSLRRQTPKSKASGIQKVGNIPYGQRLPRTELEENIALVANISMNIAIFLSIFLLISLSYGMFIDQWFVQRYLSNLVLIILGLAGVRIFIRLGLSF